MTRRHPASVAELAPEAFRALRELEAAVWLEPRLRELVEIRTAQLDGAADSLLRHAREAVELGEDPHRLASLGGWRRSPLFAAHERAALALAEALAFPDDRDALAAARAEAEARLPPRALVQVVVACVAANAWNRLQLATGPAPSAAATGEEARAA